MEPLNTRHFRSSPPGGSVRIGYAPEVLPDELFYSWLARITLLNAMGTPRECLMRIFGCSTFVPCIDLPTRLLSVHERLKKWLPFDTVDQLLEETTLLSYHRPFITANRYQLVRNSLLEGRAGGIKTQMGRVANRFGANPSLRWCSKCLEEGIEHYGSTFWMRRHQLPGINCCTSHKITLQHVPLISRTDRQKFIFPPAYTPLQAKSDTDPHPHQIRFADLSEELLRSKLPVTDGSLRSATYRMAAIAIGHNKRNGWLDHQGLAMAMRQKYDDFESFEHRERLLSPAADGLNWVRDLIERPERAVHPICHLILIEYLFGSIAAFMASYLSIESSLGCSGQEGIQLSVLENPEIEKSILDSNENALLQNISLSCTKVAKLVGKCVTTIVSLRRTQGIQIQERRKYIKPDVIDKVREYLRTDVTLPEIGKRSGISLSSVYRILAENPKLREHQKLHFHSAEVKKHRKNWIAAAKSHPGAGASTVRSFVPATYAWLYRNDRAWLSTFAKTVHHRRSPVTRVNWYERDKQLSKQLLYQLNVLQQIKPPQQITMSRLIRPLGETMIRRNIKKLPKLYECIKLAIESRDAFRKRRVAFTVTALSKSGPDLRLWRVKKHSGLRFWDDNLAAYTNCLIDSVRAQNSIHPNCLS